MKPRLLLAYALPFIACGVQWWLWQDWFKPLVWFLFYPAVFFSAWLGGLRSGILSTLASTLLAWYFFVPPEQSLAIDRPSSVASMAVFVLMGVSFAWFHERLQRGLRSSEARFEATFEQAAVGIALVAPDGSWLKVNHKLCEIVGYSQRELLALTFQDITHPDDLALDLGYVQRMLKREIDTYTLEKRYLKKGGSIIWINLTVALVWKQDGSPDYFISVVEDVSRRKAAVAALLESETDLREAKRLAGLGYWQWDLATNRQVWSEEVYRFYGLDPSLPPIEYGEVSRYFTEQSWAKLADAIERGLSEGVPYQCDAEVVRSDGEHGWVTVRGEAVRDAKGEIVVLRGTIQDITARKRIESELLESERRFRHLFHEAPLPLCYVDDRGLLRDRNQRFDQVFGYSHEELRNLDDWWRLAYPDPSYRAWVQDTWNAAVQMAIAGKSDIVPYEYDIHCNSGEVRTFQVSGIQVGKDFLATFFDVTDRHRAEVAIQTLNANLEQRVAERTAELTAANQELDAFAYAVSHDLRAPLRAMSGFSAALSEDYGARLDDEAQVYLDQIILASRRMEQLIDGILTLSRSTRGDMLHDRIDLSGMAARLLEELAREEPARKVTWQVEPGLVAWGDGRMIEAAMINLLGNAWKYTSQVECPEIRVYAGEVDGLRGFCIADNGAGFDMAHAQRLFKPFQRLHRQDEFPGLGIGLATVQRIARRHGGEIAARGELGKGATFCLGLPDMATGGTNNKEEATQ